jgi:WD40 repeat protein
VLEGYSNVARLVVFSHDSKIVASASKDKIARIWNVETGKYKQVLEGYSYLVYLVVFSYDSKIVVLASYNKIVRI